MVKHAGRVKGVIAAHVLPCRVASVGTAVLSSAMTAVGNTKLVTVDQLAVRIALDNAKHAKQLAAKPLIARSSSVVKMNSAKRCTVGSVLMTSIMTSKFVRPAANSCVPTVDI